MRTDGHRWRFGLFAWMLVATSCSVQAAPEQDLGRIDPAKSTAERLERHRAARAGRLPLPLPGTPDTERPLARLAEKGLALGVPVMIRAFKTESELEVWAAQGDTYILFATYPICYWSGALGPKLREGDRQTPEGFYTITADQLHFGGRWRRSLDIGYPNVFDRVNGRTGSVILVHGGCDSIGCLAMTDAVSSELYDLVSAALRTVEHVPVHVFPFRMTEANLAVQGPHAARPFWADLKLGYDAFERTRRPPRVSVCARRYQVGDAPAGQEGAPGAVEICPEDVYMTYEGLRPEKAKAAQKGVSASRSERAAHTGSGCSPQLASCRRWMALRERRAAGAVAQARPVNARQRSRMR